MVKEYSLKVGVIGIGGWGKNHVRVLSELGVLDAVCDVSSERLTEASSRYDVTGFTSIDEMLNEKRLDACLVCTPTKTHFDVSRKIMDNGIHVFVEKPLSFSSRECEEMIKLAREKRLVLTSGYIERFNPAVQEVKKLIDENKYGELIMMEFHRESRMPLHIKDVGIIYDTSVHDIDTAMYLFKSTPNVVFARAGKTFHDYEDFATIMLGFENQRVAIIASNWITPKKNRTFSAVLTEGIITGDFLTQEIKIDYAEATLIPRHNKSEPLTIEMRSFLDAVSKRIPGPLVSAEDATNVTKVAEAAILSAQKGSPIYLNLR